MKQKPYLRIQALVLVLLLILTSFVVFPQQVQADPMVAADEESTPAGSSTEDQTPDVPAGSSIEDQTDLEQIENETKVETAADFTEELPDTPVESTIKTENNPEKSDDAHYDIMPLSESDEVQQLSEDSIKENPNDQIPDIEKTDLAIADNLARTLKLQGDFEFDPITGTITNYLGSDTVVDIPSEINGTAEALGDNAFKARQLTELQFPTVSSK